MIKNKSYQYRINIVAGGTLEGMVRGMAYLLSK